MERITVKDIDRLVGQLAQNYPGQKLALQQGNQTYGRAWRLYFDEGGYTSFPGLSDGYLGWTRREAYQTLRGIVAGMEAQRLVQADDIREAVSVLDLAYDGDPELNRRLHTLVAGF